MTPTAGQGGNTAIESVAVLANLLHNAKSRESPLDYDGACKMFQKYHESRIGRVLDIAESSGAMTRIQALDTPFWEFMARLVPVLGEEWEINSTSDLLCKSEALHFVKYKGREGTIPWGGWNLEEYLDERNNVRLRITRYLRNMIFLVIGWNIVGQAIKFQSVPFFLTRGSLLLHGKEQDAERSMFYLRQPVIQYTAQESSPWPSFVAGMNMLPIGVITTIESYRVQNIRAVIKL